jgi:hypothetical protein
MFAFAQSPVLSRPFPHVLQENWLEEGLYRELADSFPECPPASGPTGYTMFRGDPDYDRLVAQNSAWNTLFRRFHDQSFVDYALEQFDSVFRAEAEHDLSTGRYVPYRESRADKQKQRLRRTGLAPDELWVRFDIMQGRVGYYREAHLDHRRRAVSLLLYFCDADENGMRGGDLHLHGAEGAEAVIRPRHNRMVMFPCHGQSLHSVSPITAQRRPRNFVQVTLSSAADLWASPSSGPLARAARGLQSLWMRRRNSDAGEAAATDAEALA